MSEEVLKEQEVVQEEVLEQEAEAVVPPKRKKYRSQKAAMTTSKIFSYILLVVLSLIWITPILWIVLSSFREEYRASGAYIGTVTTNFFPNAFGVKAYVDLFSGDFNGLDYAFPKWLLNTLIVSVSCCVISTFLVLSVAYCMSKLRFKLRKTFMNISMIIGLFPGFMSMIAIYFLLKSMHLTQNLFGLIVAYSAGAGLGFQVSKGFFDVIPTSLVESAKLDGCTNFKIFIKIILPLSKPIIIYTALMSFTGPWMDFIFAQVILGAANPELWTVSVGLSNMIFGPQANQALFTRFAAGCVIVAIPITSLFLFMQKYYVEGVTAGAVKG